VVEGKVVDGTARVGKAKDVEGMAEEFLGALRNVAGNIKKEKKDAQTRIAEAIEKSRKLRRAEAKWGNPGNDRLTV
jgi:hypothetical protein